MAKKQIFRGKEIEELKNMSIEEFVQLVPSRSRRTLKRGFTTAQKRFLAKVKDLKEGKRKKPVKTHCRNMVIIPELLDLTIHVYNGKTFVPILITHEKLGHYLGEFSLSRNLVKHSAPGIGATKSSSSASVK
jgi:small subunit ribosomal protein S19